MKYVCCGMGAALVCHTGIMHGWLSMFVAAACYAAGAGFAFFVATEQADLALRERELEIQRRDAEREAAAS